MRPNNLNNFKVKKVSLHSQTVPKSVFSAPKFHTEAFKPNPEVNVNRFSLFPPAPSPYKLSSAKLQIFTPKDERERFFKDDEKKKKEEQQANSIDQTNLKGKHASEPPSGHSYGKSAKSYGDYAGEEESQSGYQAATGTGYGSNSGPGAAGGGGSSGAASAGGRGDASGGAGSPSSSASSSGTGGASTGKQSGSETKWPPSGTTHSQSNWPPTTSQSTSGDPWIQSGHATGTNWAPEKTDQKESKSKKDEGQTDTTTAEHFRKYARGEYDTDDQRLKSDKKSEKTDYQNKDDFEKMGLAPDTDPLKRTFTSTSFPEVTSKESMDSSTQRTAEDTIAMKRAKGEKDINEGGVESQYDQRQFNNAFENLSKAAPETADVVRSAAQKAVETINRTSSGEGLYASIKPSEKQSADWNNNNIQDKSFYTQPKEGDKNKENKGSIDVKGSSDKGQSSASNEKNLEHREGKEYENQVKGLEHKDETFYADNLGKKSAIKGDPYTALDKTSKDYEHRVKGTNYQDIEEPTVETMKKDTYDAVKGAFNQAKDKFNQTEGSVADKAKSAYNQVEGTVKGAYDKVADKAKDVYQNVSEKTTGLYNDMENKAKDVVFDNVKESAYDTVADKAKSAYNQVEGTVKGAFDQVKDKFTNENMKQMNRDDFTSGQRAVTDERTGERRIVTGDDVKQAGEGTSEGINFQSVASTIVNKVKETAENVKEKVENMIHSVAGEHKQPEREARDNEREGVSAQGTASTRPEEPNEFLNRPTTASGAHNQEEKDKDIKKRNEFNRNFHPDQDNNVGHASS